MASGNAYWLTDISKAAKEFIAIWILLGKCTFRLWHAIKKVFFSDVWRIVYIVNLFGSFLVWILLANSIKDKLKKKYQHFLSIHFVWYLCPKNEKVVQGRFIVSPQEALNSCLLHSEQAISFLKFICLMANAFYFLKLGQNTLWTEYSTNN